MLNNITLMGRLTRDPELRYTTIGNIPVCSFTLAVDRDAKSQDGSRSTDFIPCHAWRNTAEFIGKYFVKGQMATATGRLETGNYIDKDGNKRTSFGINVNSVYFADSKKDTQGPPAASPAAESAAPAAAPAAPWPMSGPGFVEIQEDDDSGLPF